ncbi:hypothetical protein [Mycolicibacterium thermoresistibile]
MPDELLRFVGGPAPYSTSWLWIGLALLGGLITWYAAVLVWTLPSQRLRGIPVLRDLHARVLRRRFLGAVRDVTDGYRAGELTAAQAGAQLSRTLRSFLHQATGVPAQYLQVDELADTELADTAALFAELNAARFTTAATVDIEAAGARAEELVRTWA